MRNPARKFLAASTVAAVLAASAVAPQMAVAEEESVIEQGRELAFNRKKGNCLACHQIEGGELPGNIGPPLVAMQQRFDSKAEIRSQLENPLKKNPTSMMPPFGNHDILTDEELDKVVAYVWSL